MSDSWEEIRNRPFKQRLDYVQQPVRLREAGASIPAGPTELPSEFSVKVQPPKGISDWNFGLKWLGF